MPQLPVIPPAAPDLSPQPVVRPESQAGAHIAEAGERMVGASTQLFWMQNMARRDEANAKMDQAVGQLGKAHDEAEANIEQHGLVGADAVKYMNDATNAAAVRVTEGIPQGFYRDLLTSRINDMRDEYQGQAQVRYTHAAIVKNQQDLARDINKVASEVPYDDPVTAKAKDDSMHQRIATTLGFTDDEKNQMGLQYEARKALTGFQKGVDETPGQSLSGLLSNKWMQENGEKLSPLGDPAKIHEQLINRAVSLIKNGDRQMQLFVAQKTQRDFATLMQMHDNGQTPTAAQLDAMPTISNNVKRIFRPDYRPQPVGDPDLLNAYMGEAGNITTKAQGDELRIRALESRGLNPEQSRALGTRIDQSISQNSGDIGALKKQAIKDARDSYYPTPEKPSYFESARQKFGKKLSEDFDKDVSDLDPRMPASEMRQKISDLRKEYDRRWEAAQHKAAPAPTAVPTPSGAGLSTMSDADKAKWITEKSGWTPP
jgi:hypothetical protein